MIDVNGAPEKVRDVRQFVRDLLGPEHPAVADVELCVSELVTNSVVHANSGMVSVVVFSTDHVIRVEVIDAGASATEPHVRGDLCAEHGHGMYLVDAFTDGRWGTCDDEAGRTTWCEVRF